VAAVLCRAIGDPLTCIFVDKRPLALGEAEQVVGTFRESFHLDSSPSTPRVALLGPPCGGDRPEQKT